MGIFLYFNIFKKYLVYVLEWLRLLFNENSNTLDSCSASMRCIHAVRHGCSNRERTTKSVFSAFDTIASRKQWLSWNNNRYYIISLLRHINSPFLHHTILFIIFVRIFVFYQRNPLYLMAIFILDPCLLINVWMLRWEVRFWSLLQIHWIIIQG